MQIRAKGGRVGFTLVELLVVMIIMGILSAFILAAALEGLRRAEERQTQATITKLDAAVSERVESLLTQSVTATPAHLALAAITNPNPPNLVIRGSDEQRAQVIARVDQFRAEMPDVFFLRIDPSTLPTSPSAGNANYPLSFGADPYPLTGSFVYTYYATPTQVSFGTFPSSPYYPIGTYPTIVGVPFTDFNGVTTTVPIQPRAEGIYGASYGAAAGIYKNLGLNSKGYDGIDNNNDTAGFGENVDEWEEGILGLSAAQVQAVINRLKSHQHKTARSEMLYALLVESSGPLGNVLTRDNFTDREIGDTDNDGLPEFLDAWGEPLQFYHWPTFFRSDIQKGDANYGKDGDPVAFYPIETRERDPVDSNQLLVSPAWWGAINTSNPNLPGQATAQVFQSIFYPLQERLQPAPGAPPFINPSSGTSPTHATNRWWDRGGYYQRRAYFTKPLIISSGPDTRLGLFQYSDQAIRAHWSSPGTSPTMAQQVVADENSAANVNIPAVEQLIDPDLADIGGDDIHSHNIQGVGGGVQ